MDSFDTRYIGIMTAVLSRVVEHGNAESGEHMERISGLTRLLLRQLAEIGGLPISEGDADLIAAAAALHDIGKVLIPAQILNKPGRLTRDEELIMHRHTVAGAALLDSVPIYEEEPFIDCARSICLCHHERWDGGGYPNGLRGDAIPLAAQAAAVADVYDALTGKRCYRAAIPHGKAMDMILSGQCGAFNPLLMDCLTRLDGKLSRRPREKPRRGSGLPAAKIS